MDESPSENPYQSPELWDEPVGVRLSTISSLRYRQMLGSFRTQIYILAGIWICIGVLGGFACVVLLRYAFEPILLSILGILTAICFTLGIATFLKQIWAVYVGLVLGYLWLIGSLLQLSCCSAIIMVVVIFASHSVVYQARQLRRAGIPLNALPGRITTEKLDPFEGIQFEDEKDSSR